MEQSSAFSSMAVTGSSVPSNISHAIQLSTMDYAFVAVTMTTCVCSILGSLFIVFTFVRFIDLRTTGRKLLVHLSIADCLLAIGNLLGAVAYLHTGELSGHSDPWCQAPAVITIFSGISSFMWTVAIAIYLYMCIVWNFITIANRMVWAFHGISWGLPAIISILALVYNVIGYDIRLVEHLRRPSWCWINTARADNRQWAYMTGKAWEIGAYVTAISFFLLIRVHLRKETQRESGDVLSREAVTAIQAANRKLHFLPVIFVTLRIWGTMRFFVGLYDPSFAISDYVDWLVVLQAMGDSSQGFANFILFCVYTRRVRRKLGRKLKCHGQQGRCCRKHQRLPDTMEEFHTNSDGDQTEEDFPGSSETVNMGPSERLPILS